MPTSTITTPTPASLPRHGRGTAGGGRRRAGSSPRIAWQVTPNASRLIPVPVTIWSAANFRIASANNPARSAAAATDATSPDPALVNTAEEGTLESVADLDAFVAHWGWTGSRRHDRGELRAVQALRPRLREVWNVDKDGAVEIVNALLREARALPQLMKHDRWDYHLHATRPDQAHSGGKIVDTSEMLGDKWVRAPNSITGLRRKSVDAWIMRDKIKTAGTLTEMPT